MIGHALRQTLRRRRTWLWIAASLALSIGLGAVPLFGVLGYELALAASLFAAVCSLDLGATVARELVRGPASVVARSGYAGRTVAAGAAGASLLAAAVLLLPAIASAIRGLWLPTCDWWFGIEAYLVMPLATAALGGALGLALALALVPRRWLERGGKTWWRRRWTGIAGELIVLSPLIACAVFGFWRFLGEPPVFIYNAVLGYFPGNMYDENVVLGLPLLWSRLEQLAWVVAIVGAVAARIDVPTLRLARAPRPAGRRLGAAALAVVAVAGALALRLQAGTLGYAVDASDLQEVLDGRVETAHFVIHYAKTRSIEREIELIARDHEFRYAQVVATLGVELPGKLHSYYFADPDQKAEWFGARSVEMTKPWRQEIYLDHRAWPHGALRHEIAHAVASEFGDPWFGVAAKRVLGLPVLVSPGLVEGLAVAVDWPGGYDRLTPHEAVRAMQAMGVEPSIGSLLSLGFLTVSSERSYTTAGSFLRFLLDTYGAAKLRELYHSGGDFAGAYGKPFAELEKEWQHMIGQIELPPDLIAGTKERFRAGSVFSRPCPHAIAARRARASAAAGNGHRAEAVSLMRQVCKDAPEEPRNQMALGDYLAGGTGSDRAEADGVWTKIANDPEVTSTVRAEAFERLARSAARKNDLAATTQLIEHASQLPVDGDQRRQLDAEMFALHHDGLAHIALVGYFFAPGGLPDGATWALLATLAEPDLGFAHYLLGLQAGLDNHWTDAADELDRALSLGVPGVPFVRNGARKLALAAYHVGDTARVQHAIALLQGPGTTETDHLLANDWQQRLTFDATGHL